MIILKYVYYPYDGFLQGFFYNYWVMYDCLCHTHVVYVVKEVVSYGAGRAQSINGHGKL